MPRPTAGPDLGCRCRGRWPVDAHDDLAARAERTGDAHPAAVATSEETLTDDEDGFTGLSVVVAGTAATLAPAPDRTGHA